MRFAALARRRIALLALFAMALAALAPAITHAIAAANPSRWTTVCTEAGAKVVILPADAGGAPVAPKASHIDHCPYCSPQAAWAALPPPVPSTLPVAAVSVPLPPLFLCAPRPLFAWKSAQSRAPPPLAS